MSEFEQLAATIAQYAEWLAAQPHPDDAKLSVFKGYLASVCGGTELLEMYDRLSSGEEGEEDD